MCFFVSCVEFCLTEFVFAYDSDKLQKTDINTVNAKLYLYSFASKLSQYYAHYKAFEN